MSGGGPIYLIRHGETKWNVEGRVIRGLYSRLAPAEIVTLREPQDVVHVLHDGSVTQLAR